MYSSGSGGRYGADYDRYVDRSDDSALHKMRQQYWTAKQAIKSKVLKKKEDDHLVASDAELDAKLAVFYSLKQSCEDMLRCIERYQDFICELSQEENTFGRFLKCKGKSDKTQAGKMMTAVGRAQSYSAQQRLALRVPLVRLYQELEVFTDRAVADCHGTVEACEKARMEYRGSLLWMKNVSEELDPDTYRQLEKFRKVQAHVKQQKAKFDKYKLDCLQKVDLLAASRCNLFSLLMANYQNCLLHFWDRTSKAHNTVSENFKGYQHFEFTILKDLSEPSRRLAALTVGEDPDLVKKDSNSAAATEDSTNDDQELILLSEQNKNIEQTSDDRKKLENRQDSLERMLFDKRDSPDQEGQNLEDLLGSLGGVQSSGQSSADIGASVPKLAPPPTATTAQKPQTGDDGSLLGKSESDILDDILSMASGGGDAPSKNSFAYQWQHAFGQQQAGSQQVSSTQQLSNVSDGAVSQMTQAAQMAQPTTDSSSLLHTTAGHTDAAGAFQGFLPSHLLDNLQDDTPRRQPMLPPALAPPASSAPKQPAHAKPAAQQQPSKPKKGTDSKSAWFDLFADLDPLANPDAVGCPEGDINNPC